MSGENKLDPVTKKKRQNIATLAAASILWLVVAIFLSNGLGDGIKNLKPNEFGDLIAGIFAPVAASWFIYAVLLQNEELRLQREELRQTREILEDQKEAQEKLVMATRDVARSSEKQRWDNKISRRSSSFFAGSGKDEK